MKRVKLFEEFIKEEEEIEIDGLDDISDEEADEEDIDIDIEIEDEEGKSLDETNEKARPPKILPKQRKANAVKSKVVKELLGPESKLRPVINKIFLKIQKEIKKEASAQGVPISGINLDKLTIKR